MHAHLFALFMQHAMHALLYAIYFYDVYIKLPVVFWGSWFKFMIQLNSTYHTEYAWRLACTFHASMQSILYYMQFILMVSLFSFLLFLVSCLWFSWIQPIKWKMHEHLHAFFMQACNICSNTCFAFRLTFRVCHYYFLLYKSSKGLQDINLIMQFSCMQCIE